VGCDTSEQKKKKEKKEKEKENERENKYLWAVTRAKSSTWPLALECLCPLAQFSTLTPTFFLQNTCGPWVAR